MSHFDLIIFLSCKDHISIISINCSPVFPSIFVIHQILTTSMTSNMTDQ